MRTSAYRAHQAGEAGNIARTGGIPDLRNPLPENATFADRMRYRMQSPLTQEIGYVFAAAMLQALLYMVFRRRPDTMQPFF